MTVLLSVVIAVSVGTGVAGAAYSLRALTRPGAALAGLFAASLVGLGGWAWILPGVVFFALSSALSYLPRSATEGASPSPRRTAGQVLANGGCAWTLLVVAVVVHPSCPTPTVMYSGFVGALSAAAADTWGTEVGARYGGRPLSLRTFSLVTPGTSGAVSLLGTVAAGIGALTVAASALVVTDSSFSGWRMGLCTVAGCGGMLSDGVLGATVEATYDETEEATETIACSQERKLIRGWETVDNNVVNAFATASGAALAIGLVWFVV